jgi:hypothetical protein
MNYQIDIEKLRSLHESLAENMDIGPDAEQVAEECLEFLQNLIDQYNLHQSRWKDGYLIQTDSQGRYIPNKPCPESCERNGCNGACKTYLDPA